MTINGIESTGGYAGPDPLKQKPETEGPDSPARRPAEQQSSPSGQDRVEISDAARELARLANADGVSAPGASSLDAEHMRTILSRLGDGFYDSPEVQLEIANRILSASDGSGPSGLAGS